MLGAFLYAVEKNILKGNNRSKRRNLSREALFFCENKMGDLHLCIAWRKLRRINPLCALVAQLDRVLDYESRGREFESSQARHFLHPVPDDLANKFK